MLPEGAVVGTAAVNFSGFPGIWTPGEPIAAAELVQHGGFADLDELAHRIDAMGLPLEQVNVAAAAGAMPVPANHVPNTVQAAEAALDEMPRQRTHKAADKLAAEQGVTFSRTGLTVPEKLAEIERAAVAAVSESEQIDEPPAGDTPEGKS